LAKNYSIEILSHVCHSFSPHSLSPVFHLGRDVWRGSLRTCSPATGGYGRRV